MGVEDVIVVMDEWALGWIDLLYTLQMAMIFTHVIK